MLLIPETRTVGVVVRLETEPENPVLLVPTVTLSVAPVTGLTEDAAVTSIPVWFVVRKSFTLEVSLTPEPPATAPALGWLTVRTAVPVILS
jgi:hypothetical protein